MVSERVFTHKLVVAPGEAGLRLDQFLAARVPDLSRRKARLLIAIGGVFVDRARVKIAGKAVRAGQEIVAHVGPAFDRALDRGAGAPPPPAPETLPFPIVHEDPDLVVVDKPAHMITAPTPESDRGTVIWFLQEHLRSKVFVVHRLDLGTSGLLVVARSDAANRALSERFRVHDVERTYLAILKGRVPFTARKVDSPISGKPARTTFETDPSLPTVRAGDLATLVRCTLETGRTHQIRIHAAAIGHPVCGDPKYGLSVPLECPPPPRLALHAAVLGFVHPITGEKLRFESPLPADLTSWAQGL